MLNFSPSKRRILKKLGVSDDDSDIQRRNIFFALKVNRAISKKALSVQGGKNYEK